MNAYTFQITALLTNVPLGTITLEDHNLATAKEAVAFMLDLENVSFSLLTVTSTR